MLQQHCRNISPISATLQKRFSFAGNVAYLVSVPGFVMLLASPCFTVEFCTMVKFYPSHTEVDVDPEIDTTILSECCLYVQFC